jgi:hypothetical protein
MATNVGNQGQFHSRCGNSCDVRYQWCLLDPIPAPLSFITLVSRKIPLVKSAQTKLE